MPPTEHGSMNRNPAHGRINLTVVWSNEREGHQRITWRRGEDFFKSAERLGKRRTKGGRERESEWVTVVVYSGETSLHLKTFVWRTKKRLELVQVWLTLTERSASLNGLILLISVASRAGGGGGGGGGGGVGDLDKVSPELYRGRRGGTHPSLSTPPSLCYQKKILSW